MTGMALAGLLTLGMMLPSVRKWLNWKKIGTIWLLIAAGWIGILLIHRISGGQWTLMQASHVYTMARMNEVGILKQYLDKACPAGKNWNICPYKDSLPVDFLWDTEHSPVYLTGGWDANKQEYNAILKDIATTPKLVKRMIIESLNGGIKQFFNFRTEILLRNQEGSMLYNMVKRHFPNELHAFRYSRQNSQQEQLPIEGMNDRQLFFFFAALLVAVLLASSPKWKDAVPIEFRRAFFLLLLFLVINAFVSSAFSTVVARYQGRTIWLFILSAGLAAMWRVREWGTSNGKSGAVI
jgi:phosphatidylserine synthase